MPWEMTFFDDTRGDRMLQSDFFDDKTEPLIDISVIYGVESTL